MEKIKPNKKFKYLLDQCWENIQFADANSSEAYCKICGGQKSEFLDPKCGRIFILDCTCEREYKTMKSFYETYYNAESGNLRYKDLIDGTRYPHNEKENEIKETGQNLRDQLKQIENKMR